MTQKSLIIIAVLCYALAALAQERVYLHIDNDAYREGETLWYKAYVTASGTDEQHEDKSGVLYVELLDAYGNTIVRQQVEVDSTGQGQGGIPLQLPIMSGYYELRSFTRSMLGWKGQDYFSRVIPVFSSKGNSTELEITLPDGAREVVEESVAEIPTPASPYIIKVRQNKQSYAPFEPVSIEIEVRDSLGLPVNGANLSLAVHDADGDFIESRTDCMAAALTPLPMRTQILKLPPEKKLSLIGRVTDDRRRPRKGAQLSMKMYSESGDSRTADVITETDGSFRLEASEPYYGSYFAQFTVKQNNRRRWSNIALYRNFAPPLRPFTRKELALRPARHENITREPIDTFEWNDTLSCKGTILLGEAVVKERKKYHGFTGTRYTYNGGLKAGQRHADYYLDVTKELQRQKDEGTRDLGIWDLLSRSHLGVVLEAIGIEEHDYDPLMMYNPTLHKYLVPADSLSGQWRRKEGIQTFPDLLPYRFYVDGVETLIFINNKLVCFSDLGEIDYHSQVLGFDMMAEEFKAALVIKDEYEWRRFVPPVMQTREESWFLHDGHKRYALFLYETPDLYRLRSRKKGVDMRIIEGFTRPRPFIAPQYNGKDAPDPQDIRRTLYWSPMLTTDSQGKASATFFSNARESLHLSLTVRGIAPDGKVIEYNSYAR